MTPEQLTYGYYNGEMYSAFSSLMQNCFSDMGGEHASEEEMTTLTSLFYCGQLVAMHGGLMVGAVISRVVPYGLYAKAHTQAQILDLTSYVSDAREGNALYGLDIFVHPAYRHLKVGHHLYNLLIEEFARHNFTHFLGASRVPCYHEYAAAMSLEEYVRKVELLEIKDKALSFHLFNGMNVLDVMHDFNPGDKASVGCGVAMGWPNPSYDPSLPVYPERKYFFDAQPFNTLVA